ncbi:MAG: hypothetical protein LBS59_01545 [Puniceicoccales bacterium]|jgi:hypothetical protein|nr:hypothetical protein [Puniceicoccales bacterium]
MFKLKHFSHRFFLPVALGWFLGAAGSVLANPANKPAAKELTAPAASVQLPILNAPKFSSAWVENDYASQYAPFAYDREARTVDVLVLYTPAVLRQTGSVQKVLLRINECVDYANYKIKSLEAQSDKFGKVGRVRLVGLVEVDYVSGANPTVDIHRLRRGEIKSGGQSIEQLRDFLKADLVCMVSAFRKGGGVGQCPGPLSVLQSFTPPFFRHEIQHNFGWRHEHNKNIFVVQQNYAKVAKWKEGSPLPLNEKKVFLRQRKK